LKISYRKIEPDKIDIRMRRERHTHDESEDKMKNTRELILDKALDIALEGGLQSVTQTGVAEAAGIRQSLLTYYFPRKSDLLAALLENSHQKLDHPETRMAQSSSGGRKSPDHLAEVEKLFQDRKRMAFFLGFVGQAMDDVELKVILARHMESFERNLASRLGKSDGDASVKSFVDHLRGACLRALLETKTSSKIKIDVRQIARIHGIL